MSVPRGKQGVLLAVLGGRGGLASGTMGVGGGLESGPGGMSFIYYEWSQMILISGPSP